jgi:hypothetical protein
MSSSVDTGGIERLADEFGNGTGLSGRAGVLAEVERYGRNPFGWIALTPGGAGPVGLLLAEYDAGSVACAPGCRREQAPLPGALLCPRHSAPAPRGSRGHDTPPSARGGPRQHGPHRSMPVFVALLKHDDHGASHEERDPCRSQRQGVVHFRREQSSANRRTQSEGRNERCHSPEKAMIHD